ncbi:phosphonate C-P lyase system protein PhnH [Sandarakinorhabdus sp. AAP62]|uniref:phosphonate C-P lyase system protein PhnH n=1 Tax=Sandarakinorhabdus sp. AAP62 TaxID=1248916 RepID=UPI0003125C47|nr:phosphonate C-P lyase system protein PhnH [Sandarakinorhabdus sp. AAP62]
MATQTALDLSQLLPGFADPTRESQAAFRAIMNATARPGLVADLAAAPTPPAGLNRAAGAAALTLVDQDTPLWLDPGLHGSAAETWLRFHCSCPLVTAQVDANFAIIDAGSDMPALAEFNQGDARYPDQAATLIIMLPALAGGPTLELRGPGIADVTRIAPQGLSPGFWAERAELVAHFQYGIDLKLCAGDQLVSIPRTTRIITTGA